MKNFLKYTLATITGFIIVHVLIFFIIIGFIGVIASLSTPTSTVRNNSILKITLNQPILDKTLNNPLSNFDLLPLSPRKNIGLNNILKYIEKAANDDRISGIYLDLTDINSNFGGLGTIEEIRNALLDFKKKGKFVYSFSNLGYSQKSYYLATVADSIFSNPEAPLLLTGMSAHLVFYKDLLEKIGIKPEVFRVGKFKSAVEPFIQNHMSEASREQVQTYLNTLWNIQLAGIAATRNISPEKIQKLTNTLQIYSPAEFVQEGIFDGVLYEDQMLNKLKSACGIAKNQNLEIINLEDYQYAQFPITLPTTAKIAIIYAEGEIMPKQDINTIGPELAAVIRKAREDNDIKAIILRVNSPGGSALVSEIIWREVKLATASKPVIVSMGNVAASGGYYISCAANAIVADPTTITGSIGIFGLRLNGEEFIKNKLGIHTETVKTNNHSDFGGSYPLPLPISDRAMTPYEKNVMENYIYTGYDTFLKRVSEGRKLPKYEVHEIAQGRVWTGADAQKIGLVDYLGGLNDAIRIAAEYAQLQDYDLVQLPVEKNLLEAFMNNLQLQIKNHILQTEFKGYYDIYVRQKNALQLQGAVARVPYDISFN